MHFPRPRGERDPFVSARRGARSETPSLSPLCRFPRDPVGLPKGPHFRDQSLCRRQIARRGDARRPLAEALETLRALPRTRRQNTEAPGESSRIPSSRRLYVSLEVGRCLLRHLRDASEQIDRLLRGHYLECDVGRIRRVIGHRRDVAGPLFRGCHKARRDRICNRIRDLLADRRRPFQAIVFLAAPLKDAPREPVTDLHRVCEHRVSFLEEHRDLPRTIKQDFVDVVRHDANGNHVDVVGLRVARRRVLIKLFDAGIVPAATRVVRRQLVGAVDATSRDFVKGSGEPPGPMPTQIPWKSAYPRPGRGWSRPNLPGPGQGASVDVGSGRAQEACGAILHGGATWHMRRAGRLPKLNDFRRFRRHTRCCGGEMPLAPRFRALLVVASSLGAAALGAAACVPPADDPLADAGRLPTTGTDLPPADFASVCEGDGYKMLENLALSARYDSLAVYTGGTRSAVTGTPCRIAKDPAACTARVEEIRAAGTGSYFVATDADGATLLTDRKDLLSVLTPIRTPNAAILSLWFDGYLVECPGSASKGTASGIEGGLDKRVDCGPHTRERRRVAIDGSYSVLESDVLVTMLACTGRRFEELADVAASPKTRSANSSQNSPTWRRQASMRSRAWKRNSPTTGRRHTCLDACAGPVATKSATRRRWASSPPSTAEWCPRRNADATGAGPRRNRPGKPHRRVPAGDLRRGGRRLPSGARAEDRAIAGAMVSIARDEAAHAELSWAIDAWATGLLDGAAHKRLDAAYDAALAELRQQIAVEPGKTVATRAGIPTAAQASALLEGVLTVLATAA
ncbi:hypothetical protein OUZ56_032523 [Daphnia magna]|uniref:Uncharacterized protein n=1 Tax=Daphnia magna TaxID=35525 RepID=A0ABR0B955_9CRUS|nr:hypothetical protein OUZ56_032523 [Daphnia magna]